MTVLVAKGLLVTNVKSIGSNAHAHNSTTKTQTSVPIAHKDKCQEIHHYSRMEFVNKLQTVMPRDNNNLVPINVINAKHVHRDKF